MKCPKCRCEVGNQSVCPYCGATVYVNGAWDLNDYSRRTTLPVSALAGRLPLDGSDKRLRSLETKVNLLLVLQAGSFVLTALLLVMLALN